jgi:hypothetical protein
VVGGKYTASLEMPSVVVRNENGTEVSSNLLPFNHPCILGAGSCGSNYCNPTSLKCDHCSKPEHCVNDFEYCNSDVGICIQFGKSFCLSNSDCEESTFYCDTKVNRCDLCSDAMGKYCSPGFSCSNFQNICTRMEVNDTQPSLSIEHMMDMEKKQEAYKPSANNNSANQMQGMAIVFLVTVVVVVALMGVIITALVVKRKRHNEKYSNNSLQSGEEDADGHAVMYPDEERGADLKEIAAMKFMMI